MIIVYNRTTGEIVGHCSRVFDAGNRGGIRGYPEDASRRLWAETPIGVLDLR